MSETEGGSSPAGIVEEEMGPAWGYKITSDTDYFLTSILVGAY